MMSQFAIIFTKNAKKQLEKCPKEIRFKVDVWASDIQKNGIDFVRNQPSYRDEALKGSRKGQRSMRLNRQWRVIYEEQTGLIIAIQEITPHDYRIR
jgi:proteic killer suppression protein